MMGNPFGRYAPISPPSQSYYNPYMTSFIDKPEWVMSSYWGRSAFPYPSESVLYGAYNIRKAVKPKDGWYLGKYIHPYYRQKFARVIVPSLLALGVGFIAYTTWNTYFRDATPFDGKWDKKSRKRSLKNLWANMQGGFLGGMAFGALIAYLISLQLWIKGLSLKQSFAHFLKTMGGTTGVSNLAGNI